MVVAGVFQWRLNRPLHFWLFLFLLLPSIKYGWSSPDIFLFRIHGHSLICILYDAWFYWIHELIFVCYVHLWRRENRLSLKGPQRFEVCDNGLTAGYVHLKIWRIHNISTLSANRNNHSETGPGDCFAHQKTKKQKAGIIRWSPQSSPVGNWLFTRWCCS